MRLHVLPALHGDALWLEYGSQHDRGVLIDGGPRSAATTETVRRILNDGGHQIELIVVTHIDADHITGILDVFADQESKLEASDVWFNAWQHLPTDVLGARQGELLSQAITTRGLPWNEAFAGKAVVVPDEGPLPRIVLPGGPTLTLLSPTIAELVALKGVWKREVEKAGLVPGKPPEPAPAAPDALGAPRLDLPELVKRRFRADQSAANGASIALLVEHEGKSLLLTGDAHSSVLETQLRRLATERGVDRAAVDVVKLPHHGSRHNLSQGLVSTVECGRWIFSTSGAIYGHPDPESVARLVVDRPGMELIFNYRSETTLPFESPRLSRAHGYRTTYPTSQSGIRLDI